MEFGETVFEALAFDLDSQDNLNISLISDSLINSVEQTVNNDNLENLEKLVLSLFG